MWGSLVQVGEHRPVNVGIWQDVWTCRGSFHPQLSPKTQLSPAGRVWHTTYLPVCGCRCHVTMDLQRWRWFLGELLVIVTPKSCWYATSVLDFWGTQTKPILYGRSSLNWWKKKKGHTHTSAHFFSISTSKPIPQPVLSLCFSPELSNGLSITLCLTPNNNSRVLSRI